ncbi:MAG: GTP cyclohydrolase FolE2 [Xanthomonadales bacterium]|nr:GTP cyclohydrolase FolE2 [Xanthomonadales bacterium]
MYENNSTNNTNCNRSVDLSREMPDIANEGKAQEVGELDWVGMDEIELPVRIETDQGEIQQSNARVAAFVNLNRAEVRGIHMSRLYLTLDQAFAEKPLSPASMREILQNFLASHEDLSDRALLRVDFDYMVRRKALASDNAGWKRYPVTLIGILDGDKFSVEMGLEVLYSSTCPCSAALARQLIQEQFNKDFSADKTLDFAAIHAWLGTEQGIMATPHSQRSAAELRVRLQPSFEMFPIVELIDKVEDAVQTPVQTAVKREDEQEFARLNGQNLMFCEDAARKVQSALDTEDSILDYWARCSHFESLHPHNAVSVVTKGIKGGYIAGAGAPVRLGQGKHCRD